MDSRCSDIRPGGRCESCNNACCGTAEEYIREAMSGPYATGVYVEVLQSVESVPADILDLVSENGGILSVAVYENAAG